MSDSITIEADSEGLEAALLGMGATAQPFVNEASHVTADAIVREAKARLQRQLGPNATGATVAAITDRPAFDGNGYIVIVEREPFPNLPLWIEKGTKKGRPGSHTAAARPFFYASLAIEASAHQRRLGEALAAATASVGLGE